MTTLPTILQKAIANSAEKLANFTLKYKLLGDVEAINRLHAWCENFAPFLDGLEILVPVIENIRLISDMEIANRVMHAIEEEFASDENSVFLCPLGGENESSARIINNLNHHHGYSGSIEDCLTKIQKRQVKQPVIVFIDDFLNSGGQFSSILETWMTNSSEKSDFRKRLSAEQRELLQQCRLRFYFYLGMHPGRARAETAIKKHNLNARTIIFQQYDDKSGIFGDLASIAGIRAGLDKRVSDSSIFKGFTCRQIQPFLELCEQAGSAYLKRTKPEWSPGKTANRILGYGNSAQLFITANNVPTSTLTCLWAEGPMQINGREVYWKPLLPRREKLVGSESALHMTNQDGTALSCVLPLLDDTDGKDSAMEVMFFTHLAQMPGGNFQALRLSDQTRLFLNAFLPDFRDKFIDSQEAVPGVSFFQVKSDALSFCQNRPAIIYSNEKYPIKSLQANLATIGSACFAAIRLKFIGLRINLDKCLSLINKISQNSNPDNSSIRFSTARGDFTIPGMFEKTFHLPAENASNYPRFKIFAFLRLATESIPDGKTLESFIPPFKLFKPGYFSRKIVRTDTPHHVKLDGGSIFTISEEGAAALCLSDAPAAWSYMQWTFMTQCFFLYLAGYSRLLSCKTHSATDNTDISLLRELKNGECVREYLNDFMSLSFKTFSRGKPEL